MREPGYYWVKFKQYGSAHVLRYFHEQGKGYWSDNFTDDDMSYVSKDALTLPLDFPKLCPDCKDSGEVYVGCPYCEQGEAHAKCDSQYETCRCKQKE